MGVRVRVRVRVRPAREREVAAEGALLGDEDGLAQAQRRADVRLHRGHGGRGQRDQGQRRHPLAQHVQVAVLLVRVRVRG